MDLTQIATVVTNGGGLVALAVVLFYLHTMSMKNFREDSEKQRELFRSEIAAERTQCRADTEKMMVRLDALTTAIQNFKRGERSEWNPRGEQ